MNENNNSYYEIEKEVIKKKLQPIVQELKKVCAVEQIPFFIGFAVSNDENGTTFKYDGVMPQAVQRNLMDDNFAKHLGIANGCGIKAPFVTNGMQDAADYMSEFSSSFDDSFEEIPDDIDD